ncbi:uncharacterized protein METZ01_LOCUS74203 [marine metagenome]|uniref:Amidohydrolase-related domain-containing protein n=1 Tax=marine metagenome TaxID=408172 RepID=A0A381TZS8_9ZZZZ
MTKRLLTNGRLVNEGKIFDADVLVEGDRITRVESVLPGSVADEIIDLKGKYLLPGLIDDQVHLREPGLTHKASIASESKAAALGGVTSFMDMPNTSPPTTTCAALAEKKLLAAGNSFANYAFYMGATNDNIEEIKQLVPGEACGVKVFMGSSTGKMLVDDPRTLEQIFSQARCLVATHCEDTPTIKEAEDRYRRQYGENVPMSAHPKIRSEEACYKSSSLAVDLAKRYQTQLHVLHLSTARELELFPAGPLEGKSITAEVCVHYLWFDESHYADLGTRIKCNPAIKRPEDRLGLINGVKSDRIDIIATDHAPHTLAEKSLPYFEAPAGLPLVQHSLLMLLEQHRLGHFSLELIVEKAAHNPALRYHVQDRGFLREGYFADMVAVDLEGETSVTKDQLLYMCGWSPLEGTRFESRIALTFVNGSVVSRDGQIEGAPNGKALTFSTE